ncbi:MAG: protein kinase [Flavobacteriales bacterium]|nr:protein kinase [Flavobacteriales bacterium]
MKDDAVNPIIRKFVRNQNDIDIDRYSSKGGFGELYFGKRNVFDDRVALKFYELDAHGNGHEEAQLLKQINHENVLPIIDARVIDDKIAYYLTPEMSGGDLQNVIDNYIITSYVGITVVQKILTGLNELHKEPNRMVHRDLKTFNILVDLQDGVKTYLADFGTIKKLGSSSSSVTASQFTFLYRTPEAITSNQHLIESDIYQVGIILYQILGGNFPMNSPYQWLKGRHKKKYDSLDFWQKDAYLSNYLNELIIKGRLLDLNSLPKYVDNKLKTIIRTATRQDPNRRYQSCADFIKALFDYQKVVKDWWVDNNIVHGKCLKRGCLYRIVSKGGKLIAETSKNGTIWRKKFEGDIHSLIKQINEHNCAK